jgi:probable HAF family extracellular repeat protein
MRKTILASIAFLTIVAATPGYAAKIGRYVVTSATVTDLGTLGGPQSRAYDINHHGNIVGWAQAASGATRAFYYSAGSLYDVGYYSSCTWSEARGINYQNQVVGTCQLSDGRKHAYRWAHGVLGLLNDLSPAGVADESTAVATSDSGYIVGQRGVTFPFSAGSQATLWVTNDVYVPLHPNPFDWPSRVADVNVYGVSVGYEKDSERARRWRLQWPNVIADMIPGPTGSTGDLIEPLGLNTHGHVVGSYDCYSPVTTPDCRAWFWDGVSPTSTVLGLLSTGSYAIAEDINDGGFIAGYGDRFVPGMPPFIPPTTADAAFLYHRDFGFFTLPAVPRIIPWLTAQCRAYALNERLTTGRVQVVGYCDNGGGPRAVRWDVNVVFQLPPSPFP